MLLAGLSSAQVYGPLRTLPPAPVRDTTPLVYVKGKAPIASNAIDSSKVDTTIAIVPCTDELVATEPLIPCVDTLITIDSSCFTINCYVTVDLLYLRFALNDSILNSIKPASREYTAEFINQPPPPPHIRPVVAQSEIKPLHRERRKGWLFTILTLQFVLIVYLRVGFIRYAEEQYRSFFNLNISQQVFREQELSMPFPALLLTINGVLSYAILLYLGLNYLNLLSSLGDWNLFLASLGIILGIAIFKYLLMWFASAVFPFRDEMNFFNFNFFLNIKILGTLLLPINFIIAYAPPELTQWAVWAALALLALAYVGLAIKGLAIAKNYLAFYKFHFIVYICSLEIAPVLIVVKLVMNAA